MKFPINNVTVKYIQTIDTELNNVCVSIGPALAATITCFVDPMSYVYNIMNSIVIISSGYNKLPVTIAMQCLQWR